MRGTGGTGGHKLDTCPPSATSGNLNGGGGERHAQGKGNNVGMHLSERERWFKDLSWRFCYCVNLPRGLYEDGGAGRLETKCVFPVLNTQPSNICSFRNYTNTQYCFKTQVSYLPFSTVHCGKYPLYCIHKYPLYCIFLLPGSFALCWQGFALRDALIWKKRNFVETGETAKGNL